MVFRLESLLSALPEDLGISGPAFLCDEPKIVVSNSIKDNFNFTEELCFLCKTPLVKQVCKIGVCGVEEDVLVKNFEVLVCISCDGKYFEHNDDFVIFHMRLLKHEMGEGLARKKCLGQIEKNRNSFSRKIGRLLFG